MLTGGMDPHYQLDLLSGLIKQDIEVDFIGSDKMEGAEVLRNGRVHFYNLRGNQDHFASIGQKIYRILKYYARLFKYAPTTDSKIFHIQWLNKFELFDRTIMNIYYKLFGKKLVYTAHNIDAQEREGKSTLLNRLSLKFMYKIVDHIIVHTEKMKSQLVEGFIVKNDKITVIEHGINNVIPQTNLTKERAREIIQLNQEDKVILFFGNITPYKGLEYLIYALKILKENIKEIKLIIAGKATGHEAYWEGIEKIIIENMLDEYIIKKIDFIPDEDVEIYFKSSDVLVLPYKNIFQSGIIFVSFNFGLPIIASDVGSLREEIIEGEIGYICKPGDYKDLAEKINYYFNSNLYNDLEGNKRKIIEYTKEKFSWDRIGKKTYEVYQKLNDGMVE